MKLIVWITVVFAAGLCALLIVGESNSIPEISYTEARGKVDSLDGHDGIEFITTQDLKCNAVQGSTLEKRLRDFLHVKQRRSSYRIEAHQFRDSAGGFSIKICTKEREGVEVTIDPDTGILKPSNRTRDHLLALFPHAHLEAGTENQ
jgi:hypothetical protein